MKFFHYSDLILLSSWFLSKNLKIETYITIIPIIVLIWNVINLFGVVMLKQAKGTSIWKRDPKANIRVQEGLEWSIQVAS